MAIAGKVAITLSTENGGAWSADVTYDRLVAVKHNNNLYISRKTVTNVEPPNDEFWFLALEGFGGDNVQTLIDRLNELSDLIQAIIDGTTQVGNAETLDGHGAEYFFPKSGGEVDGNVEAKSTEAVARKIAVENSLRRVTLEVGTDGTVYLWDATNGKPIGSFLLDGTNTINGTASGNLPLTGGTVSSEEVTVFTVNSESDDSRVYIGFDKKGARQGFLGFNGENKPVFGVVGGVVRELLHTGNKPTGTYTGNGDATARTIDTGGIGMACLVICDGAFMWVCEEGAVGRSLNGTSLVILPKSECKFKDGVLTLATTNTSINAQKTYSYQVL